MCRYDNAPYIAIQPDSELLNANVSGHITLSPAAEACGDGSVTRNTTSNTQQHVLINAAALPAGHPYIASMRNLINSKYPTMPTAQRNQLIGAAYALLPPDSPYFPTAYAAANGVPAGQPLVLLFRSIPTGVRKTQDVTDNIRFVGGVRGLVAGWDYDAGVLYSENKISTSLVQGWVQTDKYLNLLNTGVINPFGPTTSATALQQALDSNYNGLFNVSKTSVTGVDAKASRELFKTAAGAISIAVGAQLRREKLDISPSDASRQFLVSGFGAPSVPIAASRNVTSAFAEVNVRVLKSLEVNAAVRYDNYQRVGSSTKETLNKSPSCRSNGSNQRTH